MSQSQVSQFFDNYPSSILGDTPPDHLPFLPSDSAQSFNPTVLVSSEVWHSSHFLSVHPIVKTSVGCSDLSRHYSPYLRREIGITRSRWFFVLNTPLANPIQNDRSSSHLLTWFRWKFHWFRSPELSMGGKGGLVLIAVEHRWGIIPLDQKCANYRQHS
jgi:hypothetical protein